MKNLLLLLSCLPFITTCFAQFGEAESIDLGGIYPSTGEIADVNGDGKPDVVIASEDKNLIYWFENYGNREFSNKHLLSDELTQPTNVKAADLDMDGDMDILSGSWDSKTIYWFENDGLGNFEAPQIISDNVRTPQSIEVIDIDEDGDLDVISTAYWDSTISWHENDGEQNFENQHIISSEVDFAHFVQGADFDQDGLIDIFAGSYSGGKVAWFKNEGEGVFSEPKLIMEGLLSLQDAVIEDVDGDGDIDLLIASLFQHKLFLFLNNGNGSFDTPTIIEDVPYSISRLQFADINQDGFKDIVTADSQTGEVIIKFNDGNAAFPKHYTLGDVGLLQDANVLLIADFTQTGTVDLLIGSKDNRFVAVYENEDNTGVNFKRLILSTGIYGPSELVVGDIDGDGDKDVVIASDFNHQITWIENTNSGGRFDKHHIVRSDFRGANSLSLEDFDSDGDLDLAMGGFAEPEVLLYNNDGEGNFTFKQVVTEADGVVAVKAGDLNGDGDIDLLIVSTDDSMMHWKHNNGSGVFGIHPTIVTSSAHNILSVDLVDVDNDGYMDIITSHGGWNSVSLYRNADGVYEDRMQIDNQLKSAHQVQTGDIDGDGLVDLIVPSASKDAIYWYSGNGLGGFGDQQLVAENINHPMGMNVKDLDQDGDLDVITALRDENKIVWFPNHGMGLFGERQVVLNNFSSVEYIVTEDLNGDDYADIFSFSRYKSDLRWQENQLFNSIKGVVFWDENSNAVQDNDETPLGNRTVQITGENFDEQAYSNSINGKFGFYVPSGNYEISMTSNSLWELTTQDSHQLDMTQNMPSEDVFFGFQPKRIFNRVIPHLTSNRTRCSSTSNYWLTYANTGTTKANGSITLQKDELLDLVSVNIPPDVVTEDELIWYFSDLLPSYENKILLQFQIPDANFIGEILETQATVQLFNEQTELVYSKTTEYDSQVRCAYDPNDKLTRSNLLGQSDFAYLADTIQYTIRFQNTGNDTAYNIRIEDILDKKLDWTTFHPITASHDYRTQLNRETGLVTFYFDDIFLPDSTTNEQGSHGFVLFGIASLSDLADKTKVDNTASIFFDFNPPIITNTATLTLVEQIETDIENSILNNGYSILVRPNPFSDFTIIEVSGLLQGHHYRLEVMDILGRKVRELKIENGEIQLERGNLESGLYLIQVLEEGSENKILRNEKVFIE